MYSRALATIGDEGFNPGVSPVSNVFFKFCEGGRGD